ncbi:hypothetical protein ABBQ38_011689 [Trebouxia sp. C0009 RCD-2024]
MSAFFRGLTRLGNTYKELKELDLSQGVAVMSCEDYAMRRDGYQVHPVGHAALTQQPLPISITDLLKHIFPMRLEKLLPGLTLLHLRFVKVMTSTYKSSRTALLCVADVVMPGYVLQQSDQEVLVIVR